MMFFALRGIMHQSYPFHVFAAGVSDNRGDNLDPVAERLGVDRRLAGLPAEAGLCYHPEAAGGVGVGVWASIAAIMGIMADSPASPVPSG